jgi:myo-inositol-1(or 4)-monophosphatase
VTTDEGLTARLQAATALAREAGAAALAMFRDRDSLVVTAKGPQDFLSQADGAVEALLADRLGQAFPADAFLGEEGGGDAAAAGGLWVVDPIDGTGNFVAGLPAWCVSIAWCEAGRPMLGVIYDPNLDELFAARRGGGASLNGRPIRVSAATGLGQGAVGIGCSGRTAPAAVARAIERLLGAGGIFVRSGSGALSIAYVAAGRLLAFHEAHIAAWDCLAGIVLVEEAGGRCNDFLAGGGMARGNPILAAAPGVEGAMREIVGL